MDLKVEREPFPHVVIDGWWDEERLTQVVAEIPSPEHSGWRRFGNAQEAKFEGPPAMWGPATVDMVEAMRARTPELEAAFGIPGLHMETIGGGYHLIPPGGYLAVHTDFNRSPRTQLYRRLNMLVYLNDEWTDDDGGQLELWDAERPVASIAPEFNRTVVFETSDRSWHGHPRPTRRWRASVAAYFFTPTAPEGYRAEQSTVWHPLGGVRH